MATIVERDNGASSSMTMIVAHCYCGNHRIALRTQHVPGHDAHNTGSANNPINVDVNTPAPTNPAAAQ